MIRHYNPKFEMALDTIEEYIDMHGLKENDSLPSERKLSEELGISRGTMREALKMMEREGRIYVIHGKGNFIAAPKLSIDLRQLQSFSAEEKKKGNTPGSKVIHFRRMLSGEMIAEKLQLQREEEVYVLSRIRSINDRNIMLENAYIPVKYVPALEKHDFERESLYDVLEKEYQIEIVDQSIDIQLSRASDKEAQYLEIKSGELVFVEQGIAKTDKNIPIEYTKNIMISKYSSYLIDVARMPNILMLNELKLQLLYDNDMDNISNPYAENFFDDIYWNIMREQLIEIKNAGNKISFNYANKADGNLFERTIPFIDYAFCELDHEHCAKNWVENAVEKGANLAIAIYNKNSSILYNKNMLYQYSVEQDSKSSRIVLSKFQEEFLFGLVRGWDMMKCLKYGMYRSLE